MTLFQRILMTLLPKELVMNDANPIWMFLSFVSPKQFFSVITRKIVENYKINLFDISLDSLDVHIWLWHESTLTPKEIQMYYSYNVVSNINWRKMYSPSTIWVAISLVTSLYISKIFTSYHRSYFYNFLVTVYILTFVFSARIKQFPYQNNDKKNYAWFLDVFFSFYSLTLRRSQKEWDFNKEVFLELKKHLLQEIHVFFMLYRVYSRLQTVLINSWISSRDFFKRLLLDQWTVSTDEIVKDFIDHSSSYSRLKQFTQYDETIIKLLLPHDILIKYILHHSQIQLSVNHLVAWIYNKDVLDSYVSSFHLWDEKLFDFLDYICDHRVFKENYFSSMKKFILHACRLWKNYKESKEIQSFLASLEAWNIANVDLSNIPELLKKESSLTEKSINFYVTFLGWTRTGRGDWYLWRLFHKDLIKEIIDTNFSDTLSHESLIFYGGLLYQYSKNIFYYQHAYKNIRNWKEVFKMPLRPTSKEIYSNIYILKMFDENALITLFQDINKKNFSLQLTDIEYIEMFKNTVWDQLTQITERLLHGDQLKQIYEEVTSFCPTISQKILSYPPFHNQTHILDNMYAIDFRIWKFFLAELYKTHTQYIKASYSETVMMHVLASLRETLFWYLLFSYFLEKKERSEWTDYRRDVFWRMYIDDVLLIHSEERDRYMKWLECILKKYYEVFEKRILLDENIEYITIWFHNRIWYVDWKSSEKIMWWVMWEDVIWLRWYLKNITYYNKRYIWLMKK